MLLLERGADINARWDGNLKSHPQWMPDSTPLHASAVWGQAKMTALLISRGARVNAKTVFGDTPLHYAVGGRVPKAEVVKVLLENGATVDEKNSDGETPLHRAAVTGNVEIATILLSHGANIDSKNVGEETPLNRGVCDGNLEMVKLLVSHGAAIDSKNIDGQTALDQAERFGFKDVANWLRQREAQKR